MKGSPSPNINPHPMTQKAMDAMAKTTKFLVKTFTAFFCRQNPVSNMQNPAFIKNTNIPARITHRVSIPIFRSPASCTGSGGASWAMDAQFQPIKIKRAMGMESCQVLGSRLYQVNESHFGCPWRKGSFFPLKPWRFSINPVLLTQYSSHEKCFFWLTLLQKSARSRLPLIATQNEQWNSSKVNYLRVLIPYKAQINQVSTVGFCNIWYSFPLLRH